MADRNVGITFRFRRNDSVGTADAESDDNYISDCFVETGDLEALRNSNSPKRIIVGRTGSGKSALIRRLGELEDNVIEVPPQNLSLGYIANSEILNFFETAGVNLDLFYQLLWKHVLTVELLKYKFNINTEEQKRNFLNNLFDTINRDKSKEQAINYLREWGEKFWDETEYRVKELTTKVESELKGSFGAGFSGVKMDASGGKKLTEEQKQEVIQHGRRVVNEIQIKALADVIRLLSDDIFNDSQQLYFITIDGLDEHWVEEKLRYKLIRALIETVKSFQKIKSVKVIVSIRLDLLNRVINATRDAGFQEEKYESLYLKLKWSHQQLEDLLDKRIGKLVRSQYTTRPVKLKELFPTKIGRTSFLDYLFERTFLRPRDAILFVNACLENAENKNTVTAQIISNSEGEYSKKRLISLQEEWGATYPSIGKYIKILEKKPWKFKLSSISKESIESIFYNDFSFDLDSNDIVIQAASDFILNNKGTLHSFLQILFDVFYQVGLVGIKPDATSKTFWSFHSNDGPSPGSVKPNSVAYVHSTFWRSLGIQIGD
ncbi:P-loop ATPase, Sll1717 family [Duganella sp. HH101]|uniref:P-loop ATPase, Sll1717 family n=1 Tax=Duganella sp. HH101 TaxID=1781066 RepID=UPI000893CC3B|nr:hypothetical protein [Duganella sp. HH101]OFA01748.1 hypothetical protein DUGA2_40800 [Duganella sp. HH101]